MASFFKEDYNVDSTVCDRCCLRVFHAISSRSYIFRMTPEFYSWQTGVTTISWMGTHWCVFSPLFVITTPAQQTSHGHTTFNLGHLSVSGMDSPDACLIQASVGVRPLAGECGTKGPPQGWPSCTTKDGGQHLSPGRAQGLHLGVLNPALVGTTHTCLSALVVGHVSSHDIMGFKGQWSKVQSIRLDWAEGQTKNTCGSAPSEVSSKVWACRAPWWLDCWQGLVVEFKQPTHPHWVTFVPMEGPRFASGDTKHCTFWHHTHFF